VTAGPVAGPWPGITVELLIMIIGAWAVVRGALEVASALKLRQGDGARYVAAADRGLVVVFGLVMVLYPNLDLWTLVRLLAADALIVSTLMFVLARRFAKGLRP